jgi:hypothetical protein
VPQVPCSVSLKSVLLSPPAEVSYSRLLQLAVDGVVHPRPLTCLAWHKDVKPKPAIDESRESLCLMRPSLSYARVSRMMLAISVRDRTPSFR